MKPGILGLGLDKRRDLRMDWGWMVWCDVMREDKVLL